MPFLWHLRLLVVLQLLTLILSVSMWCLISLIAASHEVLSCPPSQDGSPAHTNLHTELNLQTNSLFSPLWGLWVGTHVRHSMCKSNANLSFYVFLWPCFVVAWMLLALCKLELMSNLKPQVSSSWDWIMLYNTMWKIPFDRPRLQTVHRWRNTTNLCFSPPMRSL